MHIELENKPCPLGCAGSDSVLFEGCDKLHNLPGKFDVVKCAGCGLMRTNPRPTPDSIGFYYPDNYGPYQSTKVHHSEEPVSWMKQLLRRLVHILFDFKSNTIPDIDKGKMLEIGCASGAFMHSMYNAGWHVSGIEFSEKAAGVARSLGLPVYTGQLETAPPPTELYNLVVGWMVVEHLHEPVTGLKKLYEWAAPGASLVLSVPNAASLEFRLFKKNWYALQLPNHLYHFTPDTMEKLLRFSGWRLVKIHHQRTLANLLMSTGYLLQEKGYARLAERFTSPPKYTNYVLFPIAWILSLFGQTGRMTIWAEKYE